MSRQSLNPNHHPASSGIARNLLDSFGAPGTHRHPVASPAPPAPRTVRFCRLTMPFRNHKMWHGNWCWDAVSMRISDVARLLNCKTFRSIFTCEGGPVKLAEKWERGELTAMDLLQWEASNAD